LTASNLSRAARFSRAGWDRIIPAISVLWCPNTPTLTHASVPGKYLATARDQIAAAVTRLITVVATPA